MKSTRFSIALLALGSFAAAHAQGAAQAQKPTLKVGDAAPTFEVSDWVKGKPFKIEKGKVYVVEFWATWCGPCKTSIPHLSELAKKYSGKITFIGVSLFEHSSDYLSKVSSFVTDMGSKMDYNVGCGPDGSGMSKTWMTAAGQNGIPTAFVVDQSSKITYIGHPMQMTTEFLDGVVAGKVKASTAAAEAKKAEDTQNQISKDFAPVEKAMTAKDAKAIDKSYFAFVEKYPKVEGRLIQDFFPAVMTIDEALAYKMAKHATSGEAKTDPITLNQIAWTIVEKEGQWKKADYAYAMDIISQASAMSQDTDYNILDTLALTHWRMGHKKDALFTQKKAVQLIKNDPAAPAESVKEMQDRLDMYTKGQ